MEQKYTGIAPYDEDSGFEFTGRNNETWALYDRIIRNDYTVYYAASGEGKSSLIRAGLLPILRRRDYFPVYIVIKDEEFSSLSDIEKIIDNRIEVEKGKHHVSYEQSTWSQSRFTPEQSNQLKDNLWWKLRNYCFKRNDVELTPLYIFDQFEEVFTKANYEWTNSFFAWLEAISTDYPPSLLRDLTHEEIPAQKNFKILFSLRTEYLGDLDYWCVQKHFLPALQENRMCLKSLTRSGAREVIGLNELSLGVYADKILQGCVISRADIGDENQPCVYALILSVVCQTLSEMPDKERVALLENLNSNQDDAIDDILLRFYKKKLKMAGLDPAKDEQIIADIEDALVDEKGKRCRRDTDEATMLTLTKWIDLLSDKENGLIKVVGRKEINGMPVVKTVEFPHDRLCKAIDSSRKERQGKIAWKLHRQGEWMQFGIIATVVGIIAFLWNALMPLLKPIIHSFLNGKSGLLINQFLNNYLHGEKSELGDYNLNEGFSALLLMSLLFLYIPLITTFIIRKNKKCQWLSFVLSLLSSVSFVLLWIRNSNIYFTDGYIAIFTAIGFFVSFACLIVSSNFLRNLYSKRRGIETSADKNHTYWPLWGGYFIFTSYLFYEFLFRTTFGASEPCDSFWLLFVLPLLYTMWAQGFFNMTTTKGLYVKSVCIYVLMMLILALLSTISYIPFYNSWKQSYGVITSLLLIIIWTSIYAYIIWHSNSNSKYYLLSHSKRILANALGALVLLVTFFLNLGFNPVRIAPSSVCHVSSWRDVTIFDCDTLGNKRLGMVYSTTGDTIVLPCISVDSIIEKKLSEGKHISPNGQIPIVSTFSHSPFITNITPPPTEDFVWDSLDHRITAQIPVYSTLEQYLHRIKHKRLLNLVDSIDFYAANLFRELRTTNINYVITEKSYNLNAIASLNILDSLQYRALSKELEKLSLGKIAEGQRSHIEVLEDKHLIDFYRELSRYMLLCLIKDRVSQSDMPAMFQLSTIYSLSYFTSVPGSIAIRYKYRINFDADIIRADSTVNIERKIYSEDILNNKLFPWCDLFNLICFFDMYYNYPNYRSFLESTLTRMKSGSNPINEILKNYRWFLSITPEKIKDLDSEQFISYVKTLFELQNPETYKSMLTLLKDTDISSNIAADRSLKRLQDTVMNTLLPIMNNYDNCIYNNAFENICRNLILVSMYRTYPVQQDVEKLLNYNAEKNNLLNSMGSVQTALDEALQSRSEVKNRLNDLIKLLENQESKNK